VKRFLAILALAALIVLLIPSLTFAKDHKGDKGGWNNCKPPTYNDSWKGGEDWNKCPSPSPVLPPPYVPPTYGYLQINKFLSGDLNGGVFNFNVTCGNFAPQVVTISIPAGVNSGASSQIGGFPLGTTCTVAEQETIGWVFTGVSPGSSVTIKAGLQGITFSDASLTVPPAAVAPVPTVPVTSTSPSQPGEANLILPLGILVVLSGASYLVARRATR